MTLDTAVQGGLSVTPSFTDGTATEGIDYTENTAGLTFTGTKGETRSFTVATTEDNDEGEDETFTVSLSVSDAPATVTATDTATGTITDDDNDGAPTVTVADASANEGDAITFTVTLDEAVSGGLTVTPSFTNGTAESTDYTANTAALTFTGTASETKSFTVSTAEDEVVELDETFTVSLSVSDTSATVTATDTASGTITNDDTATVTVGAVSGTEGGSVAATATLDKAVEGGFQLFLNASAGTATIDPDGNNYSTTDFGAALVALQFTGNAGEQQSLDRNWVAIHQDEVVEGTETFNITYRLGPLPGEGLVLSPVPASVTVSGPATGSILDDDSAAVTIEDASAAEGDAITFTVTLDTAVQGGLTVTPSFTNGTARGADYTQNTAALRFSGMAGEEKTFAVTTAEDDVAEADEVFTVSMAVSEAAGTVTATDTATGTVIDDDVATVTIDDAVAVEGERLSFTVTLNGAVEGGLTVTPEFTDNTATKGVDYVDNAAPLNFSGTAGETQTFSVDTTEDDDNEGAETFSVSLTPSNVLAEVKATDTATGTIADKDVAVLTIDDAVAAEGDALSFTVKLSQTIKDGLTVTPSFTDGTATKGTDYTENTAAVTFVGNAGETQTVTVFTTEDDLVEASETFTVSLSASGASVAVVASDTATGTITDDDGGATVTIEDAAADEGKSLTFTVTLNKAVADGLTVTPSFTDGTATKGTDYKENTAALTFAGTEGEQKTFTVSTTEDTAKEHHETFTVSLAVSETSATVTATDTATGTITDDDGALAAVTVEDVSAAEGETLTFTVTLDEAVTGGLTVTPSFTDVSATKGTDYRENTAALTFAGAANETQTFTVSTTDDTAVEADETFTVSLAVSGATAEVTATDTATGTITNDDGSAAVTIENASADEGDAITFTVTLDKAVAGGLTVTPSFTDGTATKGTDYKENTAGVDLRRYGERDPELHGGDHRGHRQGAPRDLHRESGGVGDLGVGDGLRHGDGHDHRRRRRAGGGDRRGRKRCRGRDADLHRDAGRGGDGRAHRHAQLHRRERHQGHRLQGEHRGAQLHRYGE